MNIKNLEVLNEEHEELLVQEMNKFIAMMGYDQSVECVDESYEEQMSVWCEVDDNISLGMSYVVGEGMNVEIVLRGHDDSWYSKPKVSGKITVTMVNEAKRLKVKAYEKLRQTRNKRLGTR